jgi:hypothetical protein
MAERAGARITEVRSSQASPVTRPGAVTTAIGRAAEATD